MSLTTWRDEFYPIPASQATPETAVAQSLQKWLGLTRQNLARHNVHMSNTSLPRIIDDSDTDADENLSHIPVSAETCALCELYYETGGDKCGDCPLQQYLDHPCDSCEDNMAFDSIQAINRKWEGPGYVWRP